MKRLVEVHVSVDVGLAGPTIVKTRFSNGAEDLDR